ncbi:ABC transporter ATP-binding protein [candidate division WS5 bacterium]|uniref:ABC transporter ATP-binding protein n=1 Tax=candidate division WS5 bacterium TaxID=2093353 RepID=A0A419DAQ3_9BACT|nr:MAG: ABC transporter ATP-binding protein [candidate division WS5 bacterium]
MAKTPVIKAINLSKTFTLGKNNEVVALHSVNFEIYSGELICFFGPSGCGKSTLLSMLAGLQPPTSGEVVVRGKNLASLKKKEISAYRRQKIGMVFQQFNLILSMNVLENIALPMAFGGISKRRRLQRAEHLLEVVDLDDKKKSVPADLSGGQQQRIAIARSLINNPWIIMADEPTGNLDSKSADEVIKLLISLSRKSKRTVILITHNPDYLQYADRIFRMKDGRIDKIEVNAKTTKVELLNSVAKLDKIKDKDDDISVPTEPEGVGVNGDKSKEQDKNEVN